MFIIKKLGRIQLVDKDGKVLSEVVYKNNLTDASRADVTPVPEIPAAYKIKDGQKFLVMIQQLEQ